MASFFDRLFGRKDESSADQARERLKLVLVTDRSEISPDKLAQMQNEIIEVIRRYLNVTEGQVHIKLEQRERKNYLVANIPLVRNAATVMSPDYAPTGREAETEPVAPPEPEEPPAEAPEASAPPGPPAEPPKKPAPRSRSTGSSSRSSSGSRSTRSTRSSKPAASKPAPTSETPSEG